MNAAQALVIAFFAGVFGTSVALTAFFFIAKWFINKSFERFLAGPHERNECPICKGPLQHDHMGGTE